MPVRDSEPVEPNGYTPWWEQHEGTNIRGLSRECAVGYLRMIFRPVIQFRNRYGVFLDPDFFVERKKSNSSKKPS